MFGIFKKKSNKETEEQESTVSTVEDYNDITPVAEYFKGETGVHFDQQISILRSKVKSFCKTHHISSFTLLLEKVMVEILLKQKLIDYLTTNETFFYREFTQIEELVNKIKNFHGKAHILCAPCATGEECYSISVALLEAGIKVSDFSIMGIDINSEAIEKAHKAVYRERNIRNLSPEILERHFIRVDDHYKLKELSKSSVTLRQMNIFDPSFKQLQKYDFVFSRNMLIYFDEKTKLKAKGILESMRKDKSHPVFFGHADLF